MARRIFFTGGSGKAGRHVIPWLIDRGHHVLNVDPAPHPDPRVDTIAADVTDSGAMFNLMTGYSNLGELGTGAGPKPFDAVVHFAAVPRILLRPDHETYRVNTQGTYAVIEAAVKLGIRKIVVASSETVYGTCFADEHRAPERLPVTEDLDVAPEDSYAMSKVVNEVTARSFHVRSGADIYALRIGNVVEPHEYPMFRDFFADPALRVRNLFNYVDARDLAQIVHLCVERDGLGFAVFNAGNDRNSVNRPAAELAATWFPGTPFDGTDREDASLFSNAKARDVLGFVEEHDWARYVSP